MSHNPTLSCTSALWDAHEVPRTSALDSHVLLVLCKDKGGRLGSTLTRVDLFCVEHCKDSEYQWTTVEGWVVVLIPHTEPPLLSFSTHSVGLVSLNTHLVA